MYQTRKEGAISEHESFITAMTADAEKVSFEIEGGRLILRMDGSWIYLHPDHLTDPRLSGIEFNGGSA